MSFVPGSPRGRRAWLSVLGLAAFALTTTPARADDWPQWQGPQRDGVWRETGIVEKFTPDGPPVRWRTPIGGGYAGPAVAGGRVYVTDRVLGDGSRNPADQFQRGNITGFYDGSLMLRLNRDRPGASVAWQRKGRSERNTDGLHSVICTPFLEDGHIYGVCSYGQLRCLKADTGDRLWETLTATGAAGNGTDRWATAFLVKNSDRFFLFNEKGDLILAKLSPKGYEELSRAHILEPTNTVQRRDVVWTHPAFANRCVYARNDKEIICVSLAAEPGTK